MKRTSPAVCTKKGSTMRRGNAKIIGEHIFLHDDKEGWTKSNWPAAAARPPALTQK